MNSFDDYAQNWDANPVHWERSKAIAESLIKMIPLDDQMIALEYGAGTGILSFLLSDCFSEITMMDSSEEMIKTMIKKVEINKSDKLKPILFDLEHKDYLIQKFDCVFSQMVLHHVNEPNVILNKFKHLLKPGGFLALADLYPEDGSFHGIEAKVHKGFDPEDIANALQSIGFSKIEYINCFEITREMDKKYPVFLLVAQI